MKTTTNRTAAAFFSRRRCLRSLILVATLFLLGVGGWANAGIVPTNQLVAGKSYGEWSAYFWKFSLELPPMPFNSYLRLQSAPVLHLYGSERPTVRTIAIPDDRFLFVEILAVTSTTLDVPPLQPASTNESDMRMVAESFIASDLFLEIDGMTVPNLEQYHSSSPLFSFVVPTNNVSGLPYSTNGTGVAAGTGVILEPLPPGSHRIRFRGSYPGLYTADVDYQITVYTRPTITIRPVPGTNHLEVSWPVTQGFVLQQANCIGAAATWSGASVVSTNLTGAIQSVTVPAAPTNRFYRLSTSP